MSSIIGSRNREIRSSSTRPWQRPLHSRKPCSRSSPTPRTLPVALANSPGRRAISHSSVKWIWARRRRRSGIAAKSASRNRTNCIAGLCPYGFFSSALRNDCLLSAEGRVTVPLLVLAREILQLPTSHFLGHVQQELAVVLV